MALSAFQELYRAAYLRQHAVFDVVMQLWVEHDGDDNKKDILSLTRMAIALLDAYDVFTEEMKRVTLQLGLKAKDKIPHVCPHCGDSQCPAAMPVVFFAPTDAHET